MTFIKDNSLIKVMKPNDFSKMLIDSTFPIVQMEKASKIANNKVQRFLLYTFLMGISIGMFIVSWLIK